MQDAGCSATPANAPSVNATASDKSVNLTWGAVAGTVKYEIFRTEGVFACDFGKVKLGSTTATSWNDTGLQNGRDYSYVVIPKGSADACFGPASACTTAAPAAGPNLDVNAASATLTIDTGDADAYVDNCEDGTLTFDVRNSGLGTLNNVRITGVTVTSHPETTITTTFPAAISSSLDQGATASGSFDFTAHGLSYGETLSFDVSVSAEEILPAVITRTLTIEDTETDQQTVASKTWDFETGLDGWVLVDGTFSQATSGGGAGGSSGYLASSAGLDNQCDQVRSPAFRLTAGSTLSIQTNFDIEAESSPGTWWDRANVAVLENGNRNAVNPDGGRLYNASGAGASCATVGQQGWADSMPSWAASSWSASALGSAGRAGSLVQLDVAYGTDTSVVGSGFWFDKVTVTDIEILVADVQPDACGTVNPPPVITSDGGAGTAAVSIDENTTAVTNVQSTDDTDSEGAGLTYSLSGGADSAKFGIDADYGALSFKVAPDFENPGDSNTDNAYQVQVKVTDAAGGSDVQDITVTVGNVNDGAPVITSNGGGAAATVNVAENTTAVTDVNASDPDDSEGAGLSYSLSGGADSGKFSISADSGLLRFVAAPDFEKPTSADGDNVYQVQVTVSDSGPGTALTDVQDLSVTVTDVPEAVASSVHVSSVVTGTLGASKGSKYGTATVTAVNNLLDPVAGYTVTGSFGGSFDETRSAVTNVDGVAFLQTAGILKGGVTVTFCVSDVAQSGGLEYVAADNASPDFACGSAPKQAPVASFTYSCTALVCSFDALGSSDPDGGAIVSYAWDFGDGGSGTGATPGHTYASAATYTVTLTVTDDENATGSSPQSVTVSDGSTTVVHIGDLDGSSASAPRSRWDATVTVTVHDAADNPVTGATVSGTWSGGANGSGSCLTDGSGQCIVTKTNIKTSASSATFSVTDVTLATPSAYNAGANHEPDGDSDGTIITVSQP